MIFFCGFFLFVFFLFLVFGLLCGGSWWFPRLARSRSFYLAPFVSLYVTRVPIILHPPVPQKNTRLRLKLTRAIEGFQSLFLSKINGVVPCISTPCLLPPRP